MKPPTKDWSSEHQSASCKSSLFQTSRVLIQTPPSGELLVRNQYSSWGVLWPTLHKDQWSLKSSTAWKGWKVYLQHPLQTCQVGLLCNLPWFKGGSLSQSYTQGLLSTCRSWVHFIKSQSGTWMSSVFPPEVRVVNGNMINNYTSSKFPSPNTPRDLQPLPLPCHSAEYFGSSSTAASGCVAVLVSPPTSFFWPWRVSAPELESTFFSTELWYQAVFLLLPTVIGN